MWKKYKKTIIIGVIVLGVLVAGAILYRKKQQKADGTATKKEKEELETSISQLDESEARTDSDKASVQRSLSMVGS